MGSFAEQLLGIPEGDGLLRSVLERLKKGRRVVLGGLVPGAKALVLLHLHRALARHMVLVAADEERAVELVRHLRALGDVLGSPPLVRSFPSLGASTYEGIEPHFQAMAERVGSLVALHGDEPSLVVATAAALLEPLPEPEEFARLPFQVDAEAAMEPRDLASRLQGIGYQRVDLVSQVGEFALRGGVLDVYPPLSDLPRRLEFLGGAVESVRRFDPETQRSLEPCGEVLLQPVREFPWDEERVEMLARRLEGRPGSSRRIGEMTEALRSRASLPGMEACAAMVASARFDLMDHAPGALLAVDEPFVSRAGMETAFAALEAAYQSSEGIFPPPDELSNPMGPLLERLEAAPLAVAQLAVEEDPEQVITLHSAAVRNYRGRIRELSEDLGRSTQRGMRNLLLVRGAGRAQRLREILDDYGVTPRDAEAGAPSDPEPGIYLGHAALEGGFELRDRHLVLLTEHEIFGEAIRHRPPKKARLAAFASDFRDLKPGDLVVHVDHGIGRFEGLRRIGDGDQEMMCLVFRGDDRLFVRLDRLDLVQKYSGVHGAPAVLDRLGGTAWQKTRVQVRKAVRDMTAELLQLYARRKAMTGHAFPPDTEWQAEFEGAFEHTETPDQAKAIEEIKADLEAPRVMDRLLVGDVGFGKTEVAMRAAFKAVSDGKQVAVLAPTTVLALQHQRTFSSRFASFPVRVEMLSRFRSRADQKKVLVDAAAGQVDILIGTHRLLSKDVKLPNLGLLVIDEEQRFGVVHKEQIKKLSANVDVLSMSATPIPRTLQMSLAGVRDMSVIETPPENRLAIQTTLVPFREQVITAAIRQELKRHGQVYFVHNRVESIYSIAGMLQRLVPECRAAVAHGQMPEQELEKVMLAFLAGEHDVLVSTTIIENGLDMPRVNTLLVNRADQFGLSQLYQLRGRVGRSDIKAYAYLMVPPGGVRHPLARRRLSMLQEFSELGSGFRIAAMDLELRGAGNLLGSQQHGHVAAVGFELYCRMLEEAARELQGEDLPEAVRTTINLGLDIRLPASYVQESNQRLMVYKRVSTARDQEDLGRIREEIQDRFGALPEQGEHLFRLAALRLVAERLRVPSVDHSDGALQLRFGADSPVDADRLIALLAGDDRVTMTPSGLLRIVHQGKPPSRLEEVERLLQGLAPAPAPEPVADPELVEGSKGRRARD